MELVFLPINIVSGIAIIIMIVSLIAAYVKKIMMTYALIIANFIIFAITFVFPEYIIGDAINISMYPGLGFRPIYLSLEFAPQLYTLLTSMFVHSGFLHIFGNMLVFLFMGIAFEERIGWKYFLTIYLITGVCGALTHSVLNLGSPIPLVGASGAIFGILGAFAYAYPRDEVVMPIPIGIMFIMRVKVIYAAILFAVMETVFVFLGGQQSTAHFAHLGGLVSGVIIALALFGGTTEKSRRQQQSIYPGYPTSTNQSTMNINFNALKKLATTSKMQEELTKIENETVPQVRDIWLDHFFKQTICPKCGKHLIHKNRKLKCEDNHFSLSY